MTRLLWAALAAFFIAPLLDLAYRLVCGDLQHWVAMREHVSPAWGGEVM